MRLDKTKLNARICLSKEKFKQSLGKGKNMLKLREGCVLGIYVKKITKKGLL
jgi:hypothetical protein